MSEIDSATKQQNPPMQTLHIIALGMSLVAISYGLGRYTFGLFVPEIRAELGIGTAVIGTVSSISHIGYIVATILCMRLIKGQSPRRLILFGGLCAASGLLMLALAANVWGLAVGVFVASMSAGLIWTAMPDAVRQLQPDDRHATVLAWTNAGTGFGVLLAAPIALLIVDWRIAYGVYVLLALFATLWCVLTMPHLRPDSDTHVERLRLTWFIGPRSRPLLGIALAVGLIGGVYWTFAVDLINTAGITQPWVGRMVWFASGAAGVPALFVSRAIHSVGLRRVIPVIVGVLGLAMGLLALFPTQVGFILLSAACFGLSFVSMAGLLSIWSVRVFSERPSAGLGAALILIAVGQVIGPVLAGSLAEFIGLVPIFFGGMLLAFASNVFRPPPHEDIEHT
jgi:predicted MFS family arabinose efflux permease